MLRAWFSSRVGVRWVSSQHGSLLCRSCRWTYARTSTAVYSRQMRVLGLAQLLLRRYLRTCAASFGGSVRAEEWGSATWASRITLPVLSPSPARIQSSASKFPGRSLHSLQSSATRSVGPRCSSMEFGGVNISLQKRRARSVRSSAGSPLRYASAGCE